MRFPFLAALCVLLWGAGCSTAPAPHGVPNFAVVSTNSAIFRGGQPQSDEAWLWIKSLGASNVVKLNTEGEASDDGALRAGLTVFYFPINTRQQLESGPPLSLISNAVSVMQREGCYVHCEHGQDRTGLVCGAYRVRVDAWTKKEAYAEMAEHGFHPFKGLFDCYWDKVQ